MKRMLRILCVAAVVLAGIIMPACAADEPTQSHLDVFDQALEKLKARLGPDFCYRREGIFIGAGNIPQNQLDQFMKQTVAAAARAMWKTYFEKRPSYPIFIYVLNDQRNYSRFARRYFGGDRGNPQGFFAPEHKALVINLQAGEDTLKRELTRALMEADVPDAPVWLLEGLASLHERCRISADKLTGMREQRLTVLQGMIKNGTVTPLARFVAMSGPEFLGNAANNQAQARYLCLYLQERGVLRDCYRACREAVQEDKTGAKALEKTLGKPIPEIEKEWLAWVKQLKL